MTGVYRRNAPTDPRRHNERPADALDDQPVENRLAENSPGEDHRHFEQRPTPTTDTKTPHRDRSYTENERRPASTRLD
ncbi:hypothetical protein BN903_58 [Halorubrum sp. AJ67]|nr:hypothetical protein BN903_58 [Halorubrum sp. AJ67]